MMPKFFSLRLFFVIFFVFVPANLLASLPFSAHDIQAQGHHFSKVDTYYALRAKVDDLLVSGVEPHDIVVGTDWDGVINGPGAWEQKKFDGSYVCDETKRMLLEHEVDHRLRDEHVLDTHAYFRKVGVRVIVITARPPFIDSHLPEMSGIPHLMDARRPENKDLMHYDYMAATVHGLLSNTDDQIILEKAVHKVTLMQQRSGVRLTGQEGLDVSFVHLVEGHKIAFHDGFSFVGHDKGPCLIELLDRLKIMAKHKIIIDDSPRALNSYVKVLSKMPGTVHLLHYPVPGK